MKPQFPFPKIPTGLTTAQLRKEIRRRMSISEKLGLIGPRKK